MTTFGRLWEILDSDSDQEGPLLTSGEEGRSMEAIRSGLNLRKPECGDFWEDFIQVSSNADAMAELLEVPREKVTSWAGKIRELIEKAEKSDGEKPDEKRELVPTGDDSPDNAPDIFGNDANADLRPSPS